MTQDTRLQIPREDAARRLQDQIVAGEALLALAAAEPGRAQGLEKDHVGWSRFNVTMLETTFDGTRLIEEYKAVLGGWQPGEPLTSIAALVRLLERETRYLRDVARQLDLFEVVDQHGPAPSSFQEAAMRVLWRSRLGRSVVILAGLVALGSVAWTKLIPDSNVKKEEGGAEQADASKSTDEKDANKDPAQPKPPKKTAGEEQVPAKTVDTKADAPGPSPTLEPATSPTSTPASPPTSEPATTPPTTSPSTRSWYCLCYQYREESGAEPPATACRRSQVQCEALEARVQAGRSNLVAGSVSRSCTEVSGNHPMDVLGGQGGWQDSRLVGSYWYPGRCMLPEPSRHARSSRQ